MKIVEKVLWSIFLLSIAGKATLDISFVVILILGFFLSIFYFFFSFFLLNDIGIKSLVKDKKLDYKYSITESVLLGMVLSATVIGITFKSLTWPGSQFMLLVSIIGLLSVITREVFRKKQIELRILVILTLGIIFFIISFLPNTYQEKIFPSSTDTGHKVTQNQTQI